MPPSLTGTLLVALWVVLVRCGVSESQGPQCDNGKLSLDKDLPESALYLDCPGTPWLEPSQRPPRIIDRWYDPEPARQICMDKSISYKHTIPNSGAFRPVRAESGEYLYCPPQRWLNNLNHAAIVLLYHPCAPLRERLLLSALARSCLPDYIITPHKQLNTHTPIVLVSWGRTLELSTMATLDVCDWLETISSTRNESGDSSKSRNYNLLLTLSAEADRRGHAHPEEDPAKMKEPLRRCCEQTIFSLPNGAVEPEEQSHMKKESLKHLKEKGRIRHVRSSMRGKQRSNMDEDTKENRTHVSRFLSNQTNKTLFNRTGDARNYNFTLGSPTDLPSENRTLSGQKTVWQLSLKNASRQKLSIGFGSLEDSVNSEHKHTATPAMHSKNEGTYSTKLRHKDSANHPMEYNGNQEKNSDQKNTEGDTVDYKVGDIKERELKQRHTHSATNSHNKSESKVNAAVVNKGSSRIQRNDEALWAAAALGFLLVLLTLSVLHTRLYRHWRTSPSLYWHDPQQEYDSVADVIRRRIRIAKRRLKRGRRKECVFIPSSSSSDEHP
ncbi:tumor protein p53-inducible protein 13 [Notolabrus celidotus]|uniref:tumor protein p53-inducible protein 13 n=1 Tax=Notolabrus celidotus TaxID=1203425 RepID=UPI00148FCD65|nr:tumor protein p53-inducible protein 13 [Notolabrus celidotus]XP_034557531.1 tumor protein p53-inducible protein 13 [Notolabrus celidotus]